jgi:hypothetical protein
VKWYKAQDSFSADLKNGGQQTVHVGATFPETHELVQLDLAGSKTLFKLLDTGEEPPPPAPKAAPRAAASRAGKG